MKKILYWPGRGQDLKILKYFREELSKYGYLIECIDVEYDKGILNPGEWKQVINNDADWWIGISLGASLLYYSMNFSEKNMPNRITLINPFSSRKILSEEKNFSLENQWEFSPIDSKIQVEKMDLVLSVDDEKIPIYHGIKLLNNTISDDKKIVFVDDMHIINNEDAQRELAEVLEKINQTRRIT